MPKFTPGEWEAEKIYDASWVVFAKDLPVAECNNNEANARLIAAAPDMYDELYEALQLCEGKSSYDGDEFAIQAKSIRELLAYIDGKETAND